MRADLRARVIQAIHALEASASDPSVEEYADAALSALNETPACTCSVAEIDRMPLIDTRCPTHCPPRANKGCR